MLRRLLNWLTRRPSAAAVPVAELERRLDAALAKRRDARDRNHDRAASAAATRWRAQIERDPLFNRGIRG